VASSAAGAEYAKSTPESELQAPELEPPDELLLADEPSLPPSDGPELLLDDPLDDPLPALLLDDPLDDPLPALLLDDPLDDPLPALLLDDPLDDPLPELLDAPAPLDEEDGPPLEPSPVGPASTPPQLHGPSAVPSEVHTW
jgi:hypothetical protein